MTTTPSSDWLALLHQLPTKPPYLRVKIWRRLQAIGAVPLKNAVHVLPRTEANEKIFRDLLNEIVASSGEAILLDAQLLAGQSDGDVRALFDAARDADYDEIVQTARQLLDTGPASGTDIARLQKRFAEVSALDFFGAHGRQEAEAALTELDRQRYQHPDVSRSEPAPVDEPLELQGRTWVTRSGVHVDRIACAWLIRRFIDPEARFKFVDGRSYTPEAGELRFDMADAERVPSASSAKGCSSVSERRISSRRRLRGSWISRSGRRSLRPSSWERRSMLPRSTSRCERSASPI